jgi:sugar lactone lactonase YvrE
MMLPTHSKIAAALTAVSLAACSSSTSAAPTKDASAADSMTAQTPDGEVTDAGATPDTTSAVDAKATADAAADSAPVLPTVVAMFNAAMGQLTEGLWEVSPDAVDFVGTNGTPITAWVPLAAPVTIGPSGVPSSFGTLASGAAQSTYTLGVITDAIGNVYYAVAAAAAPPNEPAPGIYRIAAAGGMATPFTLADAVTPPMAFANGLDFKGQDLYVADSEGVIYQVSQAGVAAVWSNDPLLAPSMSACGGAVPLPIGANGIVHDANNFYVTNTNFGRLIRIPIRSDGSAGPATVIKEDCAALVGADGLLIDPKDNTFIIALNVQNKVVRVAMDGSSVSVLAAGGPFANPASPIIDTSAGGQRRVIVSNTAFFTPADAGMSPGLVAFPIP